MWKMKTLTLLAFAAALISIGPAAVAAEQAFKIVVHHEVFVSAGHRIRVETFAPEGTGRFPAVLVLHTSAGTLIGKGALEHFSRRLAEQGMVAFFVRYFDRTNTLFAGDRAIKELSPLWVKTVEDAVGFAAAHPRVDARAIGIFGYSLGAFIAVAESSRDPRVKAIVEIAGGIFEGFAGHLQRLPPALIVHGRADRRVPVARAIELERAAHRLGARPEVKIYEGEGHLLTGSAAEDATRRAIDFLGQALKAKHS